MEIYVTVCTGFLSVETSPAPGVVRDCEPKPGGPITSPPALHCSLFYHQTQKTRFLKGLSLFFAV